jgi:hypothetical protein
MEPHMAKAMLVVGVLLGLMVPAQPDAQPPRCMSPSEFVRAAAVDGDIVPLNDYDRKTSGGFEYAYVDQRHKHFVYFWFKLIPGDMAVGSFDLSDGDEFYFSRIGVQLADHMWGENAAFVIPRLFFLAHGATSDIIRVDLREFAGGHTEKKVSKETSSAYKC